jgi:hypothetical protein
MTLTHHVMPRGWRPPGGRDRRPLTPLAPGSKRYEATFLRPNVGDGATRRELWGATSADGLWSYDRQDDEGTTWSILFLPSVVDGKPGQGRHGYGTLADARADTERMMLLNGETLPEVLAELRHEAGLAAFGADPATRVDGHRWLSVHIRRAGADEADFRCECGGLLLPVNQAGDLLAHLDACAECWTYGQPGIADRTEACEHVTCGDPRPVQCAHWGSNGCTAYAKPTRGISDAAAYAAGRAGCPRGSEECCLACCSGE